MSHHPSIPTLRSPALCAADTDEITSSHFWVAPSRRIVWQRFLTRSTVAYPVHTHAEYNAVLCLAGAVEVEQQGNRQVAEPGEVIFGNAGVPHASKYMPSASRCEVLNLTLSADLVEKVATDVYIKGSKRMNQPVFLGKLTSQSLRLLAAEVRSALDHRGCDQSERLHSLGRRMLAELLRAHARPALIEEQNAALHELLPRWQYVKTHELMMKTSKDTFSIPYVAHQLGISPGRFHLLFRSTTGVPPGQYFSNLVLAKAGSRLNSSNASVKEISYELGYCTPSHLCSVFKRHYGVSPLNFRQLPDETRSRVLGRSAGI